jgi:hypothetical protein
VFFLEEGEGGVYKVKTANNVVCINLLTTKTTVAFKGPVRTAQ